MQSCAAYGGSPPALVEPLRGVLAAIPRICWHPPGLGFLVRIQAALPRIVRRLLGVNVMGSSPSPRWSEWVVVPSVFRIQGKQTMLPFKLFAACGGSHLALQTGLCRLPRF